MNTRTFFKSLGVGLAALTAAPITIYNQKESTPNPDYSVDILRPRFFGGYTFIEKQPWRAIRKGDYYRHIPNKEGVMPTLFIPGWIRADKVISYGKSHFVTVGYPNKFNKS